MFDIIASTRASFRYIDVTSPPRLMDPEFLYQFSLWLLKEQPISLAVNSNDYALAEELFNTTGMVVFTVGSLENPALTAQARPQDGECFGEFPPRKDLTAHTYIPMLVPTPTPAYNSVYSVDFLLAKAKNPGSLLDRLHFDAVGRRHQL